MQIIQEKSIGIDGKVFVERRSELRRRVLKTAILSFNKGCSTFECIVRNVSERGAQLSLCETFALPAQIGVRINGQPPKIGRIHWRSQSAMGVEFIASLGTN